MVRVLRAIGAVCFVALGILAAWAAQRSANPNGPGYTSDGRLLKPEHYREWVWLSSGLGMSYSATAASNKDPPFDNVFVNPEAYRGFLQTGKWPDKTVLILELRSSVSRASINQHGHFQAGLRAIEAHVKDEKRFPGGWAFFGFERSGEPARLIPRTASCYTCHTQSGAVDTTFVQFYPTLFEIAKQKRTLALHGLQ
jgi:hypothetical protein